MGENCAVCTQIDQCSQLINSIIENYFTQKMREVMDNLSSDHQLAFLTINNDLTDYRINLSFTQSKL